MQSVAASLPLLLFSYKVLCSNSWVDPEALQGMSSLTRLVLKENQIEEIPDWLTQMENLETLYLEDNPLPGHPADETIDAVAFSPVAPLLASCGSDHSVRLWKI